MADTTIAPDFQTSIDMLSAIAKEKGDDFRIQVMRKASPAAPLSSIATFDGANVGHFAVPQAWLVPFCGGGPVFLLWAYHASEPTKLVVQVFPPTINGQIKDPDLLAPSRDGWNGPSTLISPLPPKVEKAPTSSGLQSLFQLPLGSPSGGSAREAGPQTGSPGHSEADRLADMKLALLDQQRRQDNERFEKLLNDQQRASEKQIAMLSELVKSVTARPAVEAKAQPTIVEQMVPLMGAFTPLITAMLSRGDANAKATAEREARREEREATARAEASKIQAEFINKLSSGNSETAKVMQSMADVVANSMKAQLQTFATLRELMPGEPQEEGLTGILKTLAPAAAEFFAMRSQMAVNAPPPPMQPPALPPQRGPSGMNGAPAPSQQPAEQTAEAPTDNPVATADPAGLLSEAETAIRDHHDAKELAAGYVEALAVNEPFRNLVAQQGGTIAVFQRLLGPWVMEPTPAEDGVTNGNYLRSVIGALNGIAAQRGIRI